MMLGSMVLQREQHRDRQNQEGPREGGRPTTWIAINTAQVKLRVANLFQSLTPCPKSHIPKPLWGTERRNLFYPRIKSVE